MPDLQGVGGHPAASSQTAASKTGHARLHWAVRIKKDGREASWVTIEALQVQHKYIEALRRVWLWPSSCHRTRFAVPDLGSKCRRTIPS